MEQDMEQDMEQEKEKKIEQEYINFDKNLLSVSLGSVDEKGKPHSSYAPFVKDEEGYYYVYISEMSEHTQNILKQQKLSLMLIEDEKDAKHVFARKRLTFDCETKVVERDTETWNEKMSLFEKKFGNFERMKEMLDFHLIQIKHLEGRMVLGFGAAYKISQQGKVVHMKGKGGKGHVWKKKEAIKS